MLRHHRQTMVYGGKRLRKSRRARKPRLNKPILLTSRSRPPVAVDMGAAGGQISLESHEAFLVASAMSLMSLSASPESQAAASTIQIESVGTMSVASAVVTPNFVTFIRRKSLIMPTPVLNNRGQPT